MMGGFFPVIFMILYLVVVVYFFYLLTSITKSLKRIADRVENYDGEGNRKKEELP